MNAHAPNGDWLTLYAAAAHAVDGFSEHTVRTVRENADVLRFEASEFDAGG